MSFDADDSHVLERIARALETIADPPDKSNMAIATKLKEAEELAAARLLQLQAVKSLISGVDAGVAVDRALTLLNSVLP